MQRIVYESLGTLTQTFSVRYNSILGQVLGQVMWMTLPGRRRLAIQAIKHHLDLDSPKAKSLARTNFLYTGRSFFELFLSRKIDFRFIQSNFLIHQPELFFSVLSENRPIVAVTAHLGAWEMLAGVLALYCLDRPSQIIIQKTKNPVLNEMIAHYRKHAGVDILYNKQSSHKIMRCLKKKGISSFLVDHNCGRRKAVFLPFLKKYAAVNMGPAYLAIKSQALIWPLFLIRDRENRYNLHVAHPLDSSTLQGSKEEKIVQAAYFYTHSVEKMVKLYPEQWFWIHKRWKTQPKKEKELSHLSVLENFSLSAVQEQISFQ